jgi:hypothetical protein
VPGLVVEKCVSEESENPVSSRGIYQAISDKLSVGELVQQIDESNPSHRLPVSENAVAKALSPLMKREEYKVDGALSLESRNPVENRVLTEAFSAPLLGKKKGEFFLLSDLSPIEQNLAVQMKKILPKSYTPHILLQREDYSYEFDMKNGFGPYCVKEISTNSPGGGPFIIYFTDGSYWEDSAERELGVESDFSIVKEGDILLYYSEDGEKGSLYTTIATQEEEVIAPGAELWVRGKNLFDVGEKNDYLINFDGYIKEVSGEKQTIFTTVYPSSEAHFIHKNNRLFPGEYTLRAQQDNGKNVRFLIRLYNRDGTELKGDQATLPRMTYNSHYKAWYYDGNELKIVIPEGVNHWCLGFSPMGTAGSNITIQNIMVYKGSGNEEYEKAYTEKFIADEKGEIRITANRGGTLSFFPQNHALAQVEYKRDLTAVIGRLEEAIQRLGGEI